MTLRSPASAGSSQAGPRSVAAFAAILDGTRIACYAGMVQPLLARVHNGRLVLDEATDLPEGSVVELIAADDDVDSSELDSSIARGLAQADRGETVSAADVLRRLRTK